ncbi:MAG: anti-sigma factor [Deltaproteobacteria bacterium]|nr:anti-sigma factor [Deltaproteobacteria bacterium]
MVSDHDNWLERVDSYALGALDGAELKDLEAHLAADCIVCESHLRETREAVNLLPRSLRQLNPPPTVKTHLMEQIGSEKVVPIAPAQGKQPRPWLKVMGTIAAGIVGLAIGGGYYRMQYEPRHTVYSQVIDLLRDPATRDYPLYGSGPTPNAKGRFLWNPSGEGHIFASDLPTAAAGNMYAVWTIAQNSAPRYVGTIKTDAKGSGGLHINPPGDNKPVETFAVTLEPAGTTTAPTGPMVLVSKPS